MERSRRIQFWGSLVFCTGLGTGRVEAQDEPPILPPELTAPSSDSVQPSDSLKPVDSAKPVPSPKPASSPRPASRPLLIIPGVTAPTSRKPVTSSSHSAPALGENTSLGEDDQSGLSPRLESPSRGMTSRQVSPRSRNGIVGAADRASSGTDRTPRINVPLTLEPIPDGADDAGTSSPFGAERQGRTSASGRLPATAMTAPSPTPDEPERLSEEPERGEESGAPRRPQASGSVLGRFFDQGRLDQSRNSPRSEIKVERRADPASETALRRRVDHQIRDQLGDRIADLDVRIAGKTIVIRARATRFWQKRNVRRTLETLPTISGYQTRIELD